MASISFTIPGRIAAKGRARAFLQHGKIIVTTPQKTRSNEGVIRHFAALAMRGTPLFDGPVELFVNMWLNPPPSWRKTRRENTKWVTGKPDIDNVLKSLADSLNGIVYRDDAQIARASFVRRYTMVPEHVYVRIQTLEDGALDVPSTRAPDEPPESAIIPGGGSRPAGGLPEQIERPRNPADALGR